MTLLFLSNLKYILKLKNELTKVSPFLVIIYSFSKLKNFSS